MKKTGKNKILVIAIFAVTVMFFSVSCSSAPKTAEDVYEMRSRTEKELKMGGREASMGNFEGALLILRECKRKAVLTDDSSLMIRCGLSLGNVLYSLGMTDEAFAEWDQAVAEAQKMGNSELLSFSRIFRARGNLVSGRASAQSVLDEVNRESANIKNDRLYIAFCWQVKGLALRSLGSYREAEDALRRSLEIHEREKYLENVSYDWYTIASVRSLAGNIQGALQALETSIAIDRRIENSWGLASSWRAMGDVYRRAGRMEEALEAYNRARAIYSAMGNEHEAAETERRIRN
jgi:tetratricopeptide (TPR) repeat protein